MSVRKKVKNELLMAALKYADKWKWRVFPVKGKSPPLI